MDIKAKIEEAVQKLQNDPALLKGFQENPIQTIENIFGVDLPDDQLQPVIAGIKAKLAASNIGDKLENLGAGLEGLKKIF